MTSEPEQEIPQDVIDEAAHAAGSIHSYYGPGDQDCSVEFTRQIIVRAIMAARQRERAALSERIAVVEARARDAEDRESRAAERAFAVPPDTLIRRPPTAGLWPRIEALESAVSAQNTATVSELSAELATARAELHDMAERLKVAESRVTELKAEIRHVLDAERAR